jgi:hypothetical protein
MINLLCGKHLDVTLGCICYAKACSSSKCLFPAVFAAKQAPNGQASFSVALSRSEVDLDFVYPPCPQHRPSTPEARAKDPMQTVASGPSLALQALMTTEWIPRTAPAIAVKQMKRVLDRKPVAPALFF